jgi:hypothetical protein
MSIRACDHVSNACTLVYTTATGKDLPAVSFQTHRGSAATSGSLDTSHTTGRKSTGATPTAGDVMWAWSASSRSRRRATATTRRPGDSTHGGVGWDTPSHQLHSNQNGINKDVTATTRKPAFQNTSNHHTVKVSTHGKVVVLCGVEGLQPLRHRHTQAWAKGSRGQRAE